MDTALISRWVAAILGGIVLGLQSLTLNDTHTAHTQAVELETQVSQELRELRELKERNEAMFKAQQEDLERLKWLQSSVGPPRLPESAIPSPSPH
jgi:uncharacterized protein HemX